MVGALVGSLWLLWLLGCVVARLLGCLVGCFAAWLLCWWLGCWVGCLLACLLGCLVGGLVVGLVGCWLLGCCAVCLPGCLGGCLVGGLVVRPTSTNPYLKGTPAQVNACHIPRPHPPRDPHKVFPGFRSLLSYNIYYTIKISSASSAAIPSQNSKFVLNALDRTPICLTQGATSLY